MQNQIYVILLGLSTSLSVLSIVTYKKRSICYGQIEYDIKFNFIRIVLFIVH
jgi:hypothetical protein